MIALTVHILAHDYGRVLFALGRRAALGIYMWVTL